MATRTRKPSAQHYLSRDRRQLGLPISLPLQRPPQMPRTTTSPWGTPPPTRPSRLKHPAFDPEIPVEDERL
jgi:hypothetical protein